MPVPNCLGLVICPPKRKALSPLGKRSPKKEETDSQEDQARHSHVQLRVRVGNGDRNNPREAHSHPSSSTQSTGQNQDTPVIPRSKNHWTWLSRTLREKKIDYTQAKLTGEGIRIFPTTTDDYRKITRLLTEEKTPHLHATRGQTVEGGNPGHTIGSTGRRDHGGPTRPGIHPSKSPENEKPTHKEQNAAGSSTTPGSTGEYPYCTKTLLFSCSEGRETEGQPGHRTMPQMPEIRPRPREMHGNTQMRQVRRTTPHNRMQEDPDQPSKVRQLRGSSSCKIQGVPKYPKKPAARPQTARPTPKQPTATPRSTQPRPTTTAPTISYAQATKGRQPSQPKAAPRQFQANPMVQMAEMMAKMQEMFATMGALFAKPQFSPWNVNGIRPRRNELLEIADRLDPDIIAIQETKIDSRHEFKMRGYKVYRQDRNYRGGGVAVLVKSNITHHQTRAGGLRNLESRSSCPGREPLHVLSCYQPPQIPLLGEDLGDLFPDAQQIIAIGDFNAKSQQWNSRRLNVRGRELEGFLDAHPEIQPIGPPEPTQQSANNISDVLDIALAGNIPYDLSIANHREGSSDHDPILLTVWGTHTDNTIHTRKITDWGAFRAHLQTHIHDITLIHNTEELDLAVLNLETDIKTSLVHSTVERQEPRREKCLGQISEEAMDLIRARRAAKKRAWRTRDPADRPVYNQYTRLVREELDSLRQERWNSYLSELDPADPGLWKTQKILRTARRPIPPIHGERGLVYTKQDKAEAFADSLEMQRCYSETPGNDHVTYGGENIPWTDSVKYLGVTMDRSLTWRMHIESTVAKGKAYFRKLYPMIGRDSQLDLRNKLLLIRQVIQSQLTYAATAWGYAANTYQKKLQAVENVALRCAVNAPRFVRNADIIRDLQYTTTTDTIKDRATKLYAKIDEHINPLVRAASDYDPGGPHRHRRPRMQLNR
ncbi:hypothetical protein NQ317_003850 [Molorchus minor]|uniref:Endonuclease/exonuclease/phosphatase domain-containing protein n=1 Tax=Molorchus minor TaxID=1323400 RepID=A0ABQ9J2H2_9CUCU|nr:hypothetical protein NQ317_003850 [Molorchus minor]